MRNRLQILVCHELRGVVERFHHGAEHDAVLVASALEEGNDLLFGPAANAVSGFTAQRRCPPAVEQSTGQEGIVAFIKALFVHGKATWRVAGAAVACALNQIGTSVPQLVLGDRKSTRL